MGKNMARPQGVNDTGLSDDPVIIGAESIAKVIYGETEGQLEGNIRRINHAISRNELPIFRLGGRIHARRSTILAWIKQQESAA